MLEHRSYRFALKGFPQYRTVKYDKCSLSRSGCDLPRRDVVNVHDANYIVFAVAAPFHVSIQLVFQSVVDIVPKKGWMDVDFAFEVS